MKPAFINTPAVESARRRDQYIPCPACGSDSQRYLFHRVGARFVLCRACALVYADPVDSSERGYFDIAALGQHEQPIDRAHAVVDFVDMVRRLGFAYERTVGHSPRRILLVGRWLADFAPAVRRALDVELVVAQADDDGALVNAPLTDTVGADLGSFDVILLNEFLEAVHEPARALQGLATRLGPGTVVAVAFANMSSLPSRALRRRWRAFFNKKVAFYNAENLKLLMWRQGFAQLGSERLRTTYSLGYLASRFDASPSTEHGLKRSGMARLSARVASGRELILFQPAAATTVDRLSIIVPVYNEERYIGEILERLLAKNLPIDREIIVVESNSSDGSREIVRSFEHRPGIQVIYQDAPNGKGSAVRAGLAEASGTIILIQDADFEYDLDDYDALLEPLLLRRTSFVLGSRSLGLDDWKVRRYESSGTKAFMMNIAQVAFARTFNLLYQQRVTDINTMLKVFRRECIEGTALEGDGFNFDIELVCKIVRNGYEPYEVPVNYVGRSFEEGKKINFLLDAFPSYYQLFKCRFGR